MKKMEGCKKLDQNSKYGRIYLVKMGWTYAIQQQLINGIMKTLRFIGKYPILEILQNNSECAYA
jgi:hypothetical protein